MVWLWPDGVTELRREGVRLVPLTQEHLDDLIVAASSGSEQEWSRGYLPRPVNVVNFLKRGVSATESGQSLAFAVCLDEGVAIGSTWYRVHDERRRKVEIGFTWYAKRYRATFVNPAAKLLLMTHAFETLGCILVEFLVHIDNAASRGAMLKLGAHHDGSLRRVIPMDDGSFGDVIVFSVSDTEWPSVKARLANRLNQF